jgi:tRNA-2-methylthio-N6-dimethylallyladenosine synthase
MPSVFFETFGCQMNVSDSNDIALALFSKGYKEVLCPQEADLIIINTCSVREHAEQRAIAHIKQHASFKRQNKKNQKIWVIGCMAQRLGEMLKKQIPEIDRVVGARNLPEFLLEISQIETTSSLDNISYSSKNKISTFVPIMRGCNNHCAYCVVPLVRGPEESLPLSLIKDKVKSLVDNGVKEVTLLGQNVNSYKDNKTDFCDLLEELSKINELQRIRFTTSHPKDCSKKLINAVKNLPKVCKHIHLPVQSGSTRILSLMNRGYTQKQYLELIDLIKAEIPSADITTDAIVGFPTETIEDFIQTKTLFSQVRFTSAFMFAYSKRENTPAAKLNDDIPPKEKISRLKELITLQTQITKEHYDSMVGKNAFVLFTEKQKSKQQMWMGQDYGCKKVLIACNDIKAGMIFKVRIIKSTGMTLIAERI